MCVMAGHRKLKIEIIKRLTIFLLKFFQTYVIQLEINNGPPLSTFCSPIMEDYKILDVLP